MTGKSKCGVSQGASYTVVEVTTVQRTRAIKQVGQCGKRYFTAYSVQRAKARGCYRCGRTDCVQ